jgi:hypothetical protein
LYGVLSHYDGNQHASQFSTVSLDVCYWRNDLAARAKSVTWTSLGYRRHAQRNKRGYPDMARCLLKDGPYVPTATGHGIRKDVKKQPWEESLK